MEKKSLILHACCAPCICYVYELLKDDYNITAYYYNPNIAPKSEYDKRLKEVEFFSNLKGFTLITGEYNIRNWTARTKKYGYLGERSERCWECYRNRMEEAFKKAIEVKADTVATVLSISPHKDVNQINRIGKDLEQQYGISFLTADFKKNDGYKKSVQLSKEYGFYRQNYCGCIYSKLEREGSLLNRKKNTDHQTVSEQSQ